MRISTAGSGCPTGRLTGAACTKRSPTPSVLSRIAVLVL